MVRRDVTYAVLHSGNYELVLKRVRGTNALYVSDIIEIATYPMYGKLQVGIYLTMFLDIVDRAEKIHAAVSSRNRIPTSWTRSYDDQPVASNKDTRSPEEIQNVGVDYCLLASSHC